MKDIFLSLTGMSDDPVPSLDLKTPLSIASIPVMRQWAHQGRVVGTRSIADSKREQIPLSFLSPDYQWGGLSKAMLACNSVQTGKHKTFAAFRFVTVFNEKVADPLSHLTEQERDALIQALNEQFDDQGIHFQAFTENVGVVSFLEDYSDRQALLDLAPTPETLAADEKSESLYFEKNRSTKGLCDILAKARQILEGSDINKIKVDLEENPASGIVMWGFSFIDSQMQKPNLRPSVKLITDDSLMAFLGRKLGVPVSQIELNSSEPSSIQKVGQSLQKDLLQYDAVLVWICAAENASYAGDFRQKVRWIECFDQHVCKDIATSETNIICSPCYSVSSSRKRITIDPVPSIVLSANVENSSETDEEMRFNEESFRRSSSLTDITDLINPKI